MGVRIPYLLVKGAMAAAPSQPPSSTAARRLAATVARETELLAARRQRVRERQEHLRARLRALDEELGGLEARQRHLDRLLADDQPPTAHTHRAPVLLGGARLRRHAVAYLLASGQQGEIHYRAWYEQLVADGLLIRGANPAATFLANISRSPLVARGEQPGTYRLDSHAPQRTHALLEEARRRLRAATAAAPGPAPQRVARLRALVDRLQRLEQEIAECRTLAAQRRQR
jgi:hypothetical protein